MVEIANIPGLTQKAFLQGDDYVNKLFDTQASKQAAQAYAGGNYQGAQQALASRGDLQGVQRVQQGQRQVQQDERQLAQQGEEDAVQEAKDRAEMQLRATNMLRQIPPERRKEAFAQIGPALFPPEVLQQIGQYEFTDENLDAFAAALGQEAQKLQFFNTRAGVVAGDPRTGQANLAYAAPEDPMMDLKQQALQAQINQRNASAGASSARAAKTRSSGGGSSGGSSGGSGGGAVRISNKAAFDQLPSGTLFIAPDGTTRRKP